MAELEQIRARIDDLDARIQQLISERASLAAEVKAAKAHDAGSASASDYYRPDREAQVLRRVVERNQQQGGPLADSVMLRLFREIMSACLAQQEPMRIAYLGPEGTFTQQAVYRQFGHSVSAIPAVDIEAVFQSVQSGEADFGVVPVENSTQGIVTHTLDLFLHSSLKIAAEVELRIHQNLLTRARKLSDVRRIYAHAQALAQCKHWLAANVPNAETIAVSSNAEAARLVRDLPDAAAIAGQHAAEVYALPILAANIEDQADNSTRFLVLGQQLLPPSGDDKTTLMVAGSDGPGALFRLIEPLSRHAVNMNRIESRPSRQGVWDYIFYIDIDGHISDANLAAALAELEGSARQVKVLGSYPRAVLGRASGVEGVA